MELNKEIKYRVLLTGGGTGGSVTPLLALVETLSAERAPCEFFWLGTATGPEVDMVAALGLPFRAIPAGKWRRYFSWRNFRDLFLIAAGFFSAWRFIRAWRPQLVLSAGAFVSVPVVWAAAFLRIPVIIHQQDLRPGLANRLMAPFARIVTVAFESSMAVYGGKAVWTGNPVRADIREAERHLRALAELEIAPDRPLVLAFGGGTGASSLNDLVAAAAPALARSADILLLSGRDKVPVMKDAVPGFHIRPFFPAAAMAAALYRADLVITRAGLNALTEIAYLEKPSIIIPLPDTHQEDNAELFYRNGCALVLDQTELDAPGLIKAVEKGLSDQAWRAKIAANLPQLMKEGANENVAREVMAVLTAATIKTDSKL